MANASEAAVRKALGDKLAENLKNLNQKVMDIFKRTILQGNELEGNDTVLIPDSVLTDFKNDFEAAQTRLQSNVNNKMLTDLKQQEIATLKSQIVQVKDEQNKVNAEIDEILKSLVKDKANK